MTRTESMELLDKVVVVVQRLYAENERLREALHDISVSQNSIYQEERAREALTGERTIWRQEQPR